jgi:hypothetical protein
LFSLLVTAGSIFISTAISSLVFGGDHGEKLFFATMAALVVPLALGGAVDRLFGHRLAHDGLSARVMRAWLRLTLRVPLLRVANTLLLTFTSNVGRRRGMFLALGGLYVLIGLVWFQTMARRGEVHLDSYAYFPASDQTVIVPQHYASERVDANRFAVAPYVQSETIAEPYVRLFVPYSPTRLNAAIGTRCEVAPAGGAAAAATRDRAVLGCITKLYAVAIDDKPVEPGFEFATDAGSDLHGFLAHIPIDDLARGRHELTLERLPRGAGMLAPAPAETPPRERIAFWR